MGWVYNDDVSFTTRVGMQNNWVSWITSLFNVIVSRDHSLSLYICIKCKLRIVSIEKSLVDLEAFKQLVLSFFRVYSKPAEKFLKVLQVAITVNLTLG